MSSTDAVRDALEWSIGTDGDITKARAKVVSILEEMANETKWENEKLLQMVHADVSKVLKAYGVKYLLHAGNVKGRATA